MTATELTSPHWSNLTIYTTFGPPRVFRTRYPNPEGWSYNAVRVVVSPPRLEVQIGPRDGNGPWAPAPKPRAR